VVVNSLEEALAAAGQADEVIVIGGGEIFRLALPTADRIYLTRVDGEFEADTTFPALNPAEWVEEFREAAPADSANAYPSEFVVLRRARPGPAALPSVGP
jgi:dihydrofolate reductase